jgi:hypothetical protein
MYGVSVTYVSAAILAGALAAAALAVWPQVSQVSEGRTAPVLHRAIFLCTEQGDVVIYT